MKWFTARVIPSLLGTLLLLLVLLAILHIEKDSSIKFFGGAPAVESQMIQAKLGEVSAEVTRQKESLAQLKVWADLLEQQSRVAESPVVHPSAAEPAVKSKSPATASSGVKARKPVGRARRDADALLTQTQAGHASTQQQILQANGLIPGR